MYATEHVGCWLGFDSETSGHRIYCEDNHSIGVERSVKFDERENTKVKESMLNEGENKDEGIQPTFSGKNAKNIPNPASVPLPLSPAPTMPPSSRPSPTLSPNPSPPAPNTSQLPDFLGGLLQREGLDPANICEGKRARKPLQKAQEMAESSKPLRNRLQHCPRPATLKCQ